MLGSDPSPCRVRNLTQDTHGDSLKRMGKGADDGDRLRVRGRCPGEIVIDVDLVIRAMHEGARATERNRDGVVRIESGSTVTLRDLVVARGGVRFEGAGIWSRGKLTLVSSTVRHNGVSGHIGQSGCIYATGKLILRGPKIARNTATIAAGAYLGFEGRASWTDSTIVRNEATSIGGILTSARLTLQGIIIVGNTAEAGNGGGVDNDGRLTLIGSTVIGSHEGGGIWHDPCGTCIVTLDATSSVTNNAPDDCVGTPAC